MGLDAVDLVMQVEDTFGISISDSDISTIHTVGQLRAFVVGRLGIQGTATNCLSAGAFYRLRRALLALPAVTRPLVRPPTRLNDLIPGDRAARRDAWRAVADASGLILPDLCRPAWLVRCILGVGIAAVLGPPAIAWMMGATPAAAAIVLFAPIAMLCVLCIAWGLTAPLAADFPPGFDVGQLVQQLVGRNFTELAGPHGRTEADVWEALRTIVAEQVGVDRSEITPDLDFIRDLGFG